MRVKGLKKISEEAIAENFPTGPGSTESPKQRKPKDAHTKTLIKMAKVKDQERILKGAGISNYFGRVKLP